MTHRTALAVVLISGVAVVRGAIGQEPPPRPALVGLDHVAYKIGDAAAARRFYGDLLGYPVVVPRAAGDPLIVRVSSRQTLVLEPGVPASVEDRLSHVAIATSDLSALKVYLAARGIAAAGPAQERCGRMALRTTDPDGHTIEFVQEDVIRAEPSAASAIASRVLHTGIAVRSESAAHAFYREVLGLQEIWRGGAEPPKTSWVNMRLPESTDYIEYMLNDVPPTRRQLGSQHHAALLVPDMQAAWETVRARTPAAQRATLQPPRIGRNNRWQLNLFDPDGTRMELMEGAVTRVKTEG